MAIFTYPNIIYPDAQSESSRTGQGNSRSKEWMLVNYPNGGFPVMHSNGSMFTTAIRDKVITPTMHNKDQIGNPRFRAKFNGGLTFAIYRDSHMTGDPYYTQGSKEEQLRSYQLEYDPGTRLPLGHYNLEYRKGPIYQFRGSTTFVNPENDADKNKIMNNGLESFVNNEAKLVSTTTNESNASPGAPTSPLHPFMRSYADRSHQAIVTAYNRTKLPIADIEHRKAFRYIFITRPECYLMTSDGKLCYQGEKDNDINACWMRMPHVIRALSPVYISPSPGKPQYANWNYLLSNRVMSMSVNGTSLSVVDSMTKSVTGNTIIPGNMISSNLNGTVELTFRDTKYMDVYETLRIWMMYIKKRKTGEFYPPYNGYAYVNTFRAPGGISTSGGSKLHPYDRALEYCASIYDIITNETGSKILYWCKYYGVYPISASTNMFNMQNGSSILGDASISAQFQYQFKQENVLQNLVEFNYNAGIFNNMGIAYSDVKSIIDEVPFMYRENGVGGTSATPDVLKNYIGAASLITGAPFIVSEVSGTHNPWTWSGENPIASFLKFMPASTIDGEMASRMNLGFTATSGESQSKYVMDYATPYEPTYQVNMNKDTSVTDNTQNTNVDVTIKIPPPTQQGTAVDTSNGAQTSSSGQTHSGGGSNWDTVAQQAAESSETKSTTSNDAGKQMTATDVIVGTFKDTFTDKLGSIGLGVGTSTVIHLIDNVQQYQRAKEEGNVVSSAETEVDNTNNTSGGAD